jgi:hypothetical protein
VGAPPNRPLQTWKTSPTARMRAIEDRASRKFFEGQAQADRPVVLRSNDFIR